MIDLIDGILDDFLPVASFGPDDPPGNLEFLLVFDLDFIPAGEFVLLLLLILLLRLGDSFIAINGICVSVSEIGLLPVDGLSIFAVLLLVRGRYLLIFFGFQPGDLELEIVLMKADFIQKLQGYIRAVVAAE